jgi:hypothetical protein
MHEWSLPWNGACRCGQVKVRVTAPPLIAGVCHCAGCQKMSASAFSLTLSLGVDGFEVVEGEPVLGGRQAEPKHYFCPFCKSWMFTRPSDAPWLVNLRASVLDDHSWVVPTIEFWTSEKLPWAETGARHSFPTVLEMAEFGPLVEEFAKVGARPSA